MAMWGERDFLLQSPAHKLVVKHVQEALRRRYCCCFVIIIVISIISTIIILPSKHCS